MQREYKEEHCWQYDIRVRNYDQDLIDSGFTEDYVRSLKVDDFEFRAVTDKQEKQKLKEFIVRHEWLGNLTQMTTHWFAAYHKDQLAGVILFSMPNAFSKYLGENTHELERLISRGACISWSPKNLGSSFLMWCIKWMVNNTQYRLFVGYSDPTAKELGTIYQACNFYYLGQDSGTTDRYINPYTGKIVSDRFFRTTSAYRKYAKILNIPWMKAWNKPNGRIDISAIPPEIMNKLRDYSKEVQKSSQKISYPSKHKYAYVMGRGKLETKELRKKFTQMNKIRPFPIYRGV